MPGLLRGIARTAVISGTATAVSGRVARRQAEQFADRDAQIYVELLQQLTELKSQGILTEAEFAAEKAKILAS